MQVVRARQFLVAITLLLSSFLVTESAAGSTAVTITSPSSSLIRGSVAQFSIDVPAGAKGLRVELGGRNVTSHFKPSGARRYAASLTWRAFVKSGERGLSASATVGGRHVSGQRTYMFGRPSADYAELISPRSSVVRSGVTVRFRVRSLPRLVSVRLGGRDLTGRFTYRRKDGESTYVGRLAANDGLRYGSNRLRITAVAEDGRYTTIVRRLRVPADHVRVSAGLDRRAVVGRATRLDATGSKALRKGARLQYRWKVIRRPPGARPTLAVPSDAKPLLLTDVPGRYLVKLTATEASPAPTMVAASDVLTVNALPDYPPVGAPLSVTAGGVAVGQQAPLAYSSAAPVTMRVYDRQTLEDTLDRQFTADAAGAQQATSQIKGLGPDSIAVLSAQPGVAVSGAWLSAVLALGGGVDALGTDPTSLQNTPGQRIAKGSWTVVGVPNAASGAYVQVPTGGNFNVPVDGYFRLNDASLPQQFSFVSGDYTSFDTSSANTPTSNTMSVGANQYPSAPLPAGCTGGLHLLVLAARNLQGTWEQTYGTNCANPATAVAQLQALDSDLHNQVPELPNQGRHLVFLQTIGAAPWSSDPSVLQQQYALGLDLAGIVRPQPNAPASLDFGATAGLFNTATGAYGLAGGDGLYPSQVVNSGGQKYSTGIPGALATHGVESSASANTSPVTGVREPGTVRGLLRRNDQADFEPVLGGEGSTTSSAVPSAYQLPEIANQPATPWSTDQYPDAPAILTYISINVLGGNFARTNNTGQCYTPAKPNVRFEYCDGDVDWSDALLALEEATVPAQYAAAWPHWPQVVAALKTEMQSVQQVTAYVDAMQEVLSTSNVGVDVANTVSAVRAALAPPAGAAPSSAGFWTDLAASALDVAAAVSGLGEFEAAETAFGSFGAIGYLVGDLLDLPDGTPALESPIPPGESAELGSDLVSRYSGMVAALGEAQELIVTDAGKLSAFSQSGLGSFNQQTQATFSLALSLGSTRFAYEKLLPLAYNRVLTYNNSGPNPNTPPGADQFVCWVGTGEPETYRPFGPNNKPNGPASANAQYAFPIPNTANGPFTDTQQTYVLAGPGDPSAGSPDTDGNKKEVHPPLPKDSLIGPLFLPAAGSAGAITAEGFNKAQFYERTFPFPRTASCGPY